MKASNNKRIIFCSCDKIALGNGKGSRDTAEFLSEAITHGKFYPLEVKFAIVREQGVSVYSCSEKAEEEFPDLDPTLISAGNTKEK